MHDNSTAENRVQAAQHFADARRCVNDALTEDGVLAPRSHALLSALAREAKNHLSAAIARLRIAS